MSRFSQIPDNITSNAGIRINDDRGNPLNLPVNQLRPTGIYRTFLASNNPSSIFQKSTGVSGSNSSKDPNGNPHPQGFTPPEAYYIQGDKLINQSTGYPVESGNYPVPASKNVNASNYTSDPNSWKDQSGVNFNDSSYVYDIFNNNRQYNFLHNLDTSSPDGSGQVRGNISVEYLSSTNPPKDLYLGSFIQTSDDNEDPVMFGYDIKINLNSSPLFNGSISNFIDQFGGSSGNKEIESRRNIWVTFCNQFFKFFSIDQPSFLPYVQSSFDKNGVTSSTLPSVNTQSPNSSPQKAYYLKKISGLDKLVEGDVSSNSENIRSMVSYGKDFITLTLYEDVSVNIGYLATLYKTLSWSRLNGKQIIPENLLRFDAEITITEIRDYNRFIKEDQNSFKVYSDFLSRYTYNLYDCQFKFEKLSHGDDINMWDVKATDELEISFNYKYSNLRFDKFTFASDQSQQYTIYNGQTDVLSANPKNSNAVLTDGNQIKTYISQSSLKDYDYWPKDNSNPNFTNINNPDTLKNATKAGNKKTSLDILGKKLSNAVVAEVNRQITTQARLLNNTLDNIRNSIGLGRMSAPTNVYHGNSPFKNDVVNAARDFVGQSVKSFFTPPSENQ